MKRLIVTALAALTLILGGVHVASASHQTSGNHYGAYYWGGVKQMDYRVVIVADRTSTEGNHVGLINYINAHNSLWDANPKLPLLAYADDRANAGACFGNHTDGLAFPGYSLILVCSGSPTGNEGVAFYGVSGNHIYGIASVWLSTAANAGRSYTGYCHEIMHVLNGSGGHSPNPLSCTRNPLPGEGIGFDQHDVDTLYSNYSHPLGGSS